MSRHSVRTAIVAGVIAVALPGVALAGGGKWHKDDCFSKFFRDVDRSMTRVATYKHRKFERMFDWCDKTGHHHRRDRRWHRHYK